MEGSAARRDGKLREKERSAARRGESAATREKSAATRGESCARRRERHELKRENKPSSGDWRITPWTCLHCGFTPRETVAIIMICEGMILQIRRLARLSPGDAIAALRQAQRAHLPCSSSSGTKGLHHLAFHFTNKILHFGATATVKKGVSGSPGRAHPLAWLVA